MGAPAGRHLGRSSTVQSPLPVRVAKALPTRVKALLHSAPGLPTQVSQANAPGKRCCAIAGLDRTLHASFQSLPRQAASLLLSRGKATAIAVQAIEAGRQLARRGTMATVTTNQPSVTTCLPTVPITRELKVPEDLDKKIADPWKPRANQVRPRLPARCAVEAMEDHAVRSTCCSVS